MPGASPHYRRKGWPAIEKEGKEGDRRDLTLTERKRSSTARLAALVHERNFSAELSSGDTRWVPCSNHSSGTRGEKQHMGWIKECSFLGDL